MMTNRPLSNEGWQVPSYEAIELGPRRSKYCVCVPVINEGGRLRAELTSMWHHGTTDLVDVVICDGGSTDGSTDRALLSECGVRVLLTKTGPGKLSAQLRMGYSYALLQGYEGIVTIDGNNKDDVRGIIPIVQALDDGVDMVQGSRYQPGGQAINTPLLRRAAMLTIHIPVINHVARFRFTDTTNGFRGYSSRYLLDPRVKPFRDVFQTYELLAYLSVRASQLGMRVTETPVIRRYPKGRTPTRISPIAGILTLLLILWKLIRGHYHDTGRSER